MGRGYDDLADGNPIGVVAGALRTRRTETVAAYLSPVPDRLGLLVGVTVTLQMARRGTALADAVDHARAVLDRASGEEDPSSSAG